MYCQVLLYTFSLYEKIGIDISFLGDYIGACMEVRFADNSLQELETDPKATGGFPPEVVKAFRKRMQVIRAAPDERDFYQLKSLHYEKLKGKRSHQHSMRLNDQYRLVLEYEEKSSKEEKSPTKVAVIVSIEDYH